MRRNFNDSYQSKPIVDPIIIQIQTRPSPNQLSNQKSYQFKPKPIQTSSVTKNRSNHQTKLFNLQQPRLQASQTFQTEVVAITIRLHSATKSLFRLGWTVSQMVSACKDIIHLPLPWTGPCSFSLRQSPQRPLYFLLLTKLLRFTSFACHMSQNISKI
jgi:hypothetical protein